MTLIKSPTPHAVPYGIVILRNKTPFSCEFGTNKLASVDPSTMKIREYILPAAGARPRRIALAPDGTIYYTDFARGFLCFFGFTKGCPDYGNSVPTISAPTILRILYEDWEHKKASCIRENHRLKDSTAY
jgi:hypothetical protein